MWTHTNRYFNYWGSDEIHLDENANNHDTDTLGVVRHLLAEKAGPILVFTMTRPRTVELAQRFAAERQQDVKSYELAAPIKMRQFIFTHTSGPVPRHAVLGVGGVQ